MKYLHLITMDQFYSSDFIKIIQTNFNFYEHQFIIFKSNDKRKSINLEKYHNIKFVTSSVNLLTKTFFIEYRMIRKMMAQADYIFIHFLSDDLSRIIFGFKGKAKLLWVIWGADLYNSIPMNLFDHYTSNLLIKLNYKVKKPIIKFFYNKIRKSVIKRLDYIITPYRGDFKLLKKYFKTKAEWYSQAIYPNPIDFEKLDKSLSNSIDEQFIFKKKGFKLLLIGNSGIPTNNHLDIMIRLAKMKKQNFKIICPLSYGPPIYIKKIVEKGKILYGDRFIPLLKFLDPKIYYSILKQIDIAIMYHNRQQGMGTINILIYLGKPICMKGTSGYFYLLEKGVSVFSTQDIEKLILGEIKLNEIMSENNKKIAIKNFSFKSAISAIETLLNLLDKRDMLNRGLFLKSNIEKISKINK